MSVIVEHIAQNSVNLHTVQGGKSFVQIGSNPGHTAHMVTFGEHLEQVVRSRGRSLKETSQAAGCGETFLTQAVKRGAPPNSIELLQRVADELGVSLAYLVDPAHSASASTTADTSIWHQAIATAWRTFQDEGVIPRSVSVAPADFADACVRLARALADYRLYDAAASHSAEKQGQNNQERTEPAPPDV